MISRIRLSTEELGFKAEILKFLLTIMLHSLKTSDISVARRTPTSEPPVVFKTQTLKLHPRLDEYSPRAARISILTVISCNYYIL